MNARRASIVLTALCLGFLGIIAYMAYLLRISSVTTHADVSPRVITNTVTQIAVRKVYPTNFLASLSKLPLTWNSIESTNYRAYIANLRAIDCPPETIRDIIITDVAKLYARRRAAIRAQAQPYKYWQTGDAWQSEAATTPAMRKQLEDLEKEEQTLVHDLLGVDLQTELSKYWNADDEQERMYGFLPQEKRQKVLDVQAKYDEQEQAVYANSKGVMLDEDQEKLRRIEKQREAELAGVLTPEEFEEYELRNSSTATALRSQMSGFEPTEDEFRKIFRLQKTLDNEFNQAFDTSDPNQSAVKARAQQQAQDALNAEIKKTLGEERYNQWARGQDSDYKALVQVAERFDLPKETANSIYDMKQDAERQKQKVDANPNLTDDQRAKALAAIARETQRAVSAAMGDKVFNAYQRANGQWLQDLAISANPPAEQPSLPPPPAANFPLTFPGVVPPFPPVPQRQNQ